MPPSQPGYVIRHKRWTLPVLAVVVAVVAGVIVAVVRPGSSRTGTSATGGTPTTTTAPPPPTGGSTSPPSGALPASAFSGTDYPVTPYTSPSYVTGLKPGKGSFIDQPARGYLTTVAAATMLDGIGVSTNGLPPNVDIPAMFAELRAAGIRSVRVEVPWDSLNLADDALTASRKAFYDTIFRACAATGITPDVLIDADSELPEPMPETTATVEAAASSGATSVRLSSFPGLHLGYSGLSQLQRKEPAAGVLLTARGADGSYQLSKPLPVALHQGQKVTIDTFQWLPLYPVSSPQFKSTDAAFTRYVGVVDREVTSNGVGHFYAEIWNELSFGSQFLDANNYFTRPVNVAGAGQGRKGNADKPNLFVKGEPAYQLAEDAAGELHQLSGSSVSVDWGYSNTDDGLGSPQPGLADSLGPDFQAKSFHLYKTNNLTVQSNIEHDAPTASAQAAALPDGPLQGRTEIPEGIMATGIKTESLPRTILFPPKRTPGFRYLVTETGYSPAQNGIKDTATSQLLQSKALLREYAFWLDKGISVLEDFKLGGEAPKGSGKKSAPNALNLLNASGKLTPGQLTSLPLSDTSPPLAALQRYTGAFAGAVPMATTHPLQAGVAAVGPQYAVDPTFPGPKLPYRDLFMFLPYQVTSTRYVIPMYVMSYNITQPLPGGQMGFRVTVQGLQHPVRQVSFYDPLTGHELAIPILARTATSVTLGVSATDYPRLVTIND